MSRSKGGDGPTGLSRVPEAFVPTPDWLIDRKLELAHVGASDLVADLGCGDGRVLIRAARRTGARGVGYEVRAHLADSARNAVAAAGCSDHVEIRTLDYREADLSGITAVILYLNRGSLGEVAQLLQGGAAPGTRIVTHEFDLPGWTAANEMTVVGPTGEQVRLYSYVAP